MAAHFKLQKKEISRTARQEYESWIAKIQDRPDVKMNPGYDHVYINRRLHDLITAEGIGYWKNFKEFRPAHPWEKGVLWPKVKNSKGGYGFILVYDARKNK